MNAVTQIASAALNSLWQSAILAVLLWAAVKLLSARLNAATRHIIWWIALTAIVALPCVPRHAKPARQSPRTVAQRRVATPERVAPPFTGPVDPAPVNVPSKARPLWPWLALSVWVAILAHRTARIVRSYVYLHGVKQQAIPSLQPLPAITRRARLLLSSQIASPIAVGFLHPAVILPGNLPAQLNGEELHCVLLHEAAHLARYDDWTNLLARLLDAALALHPVAWWLLRQIEREREIACDDWVVAHTGAARGYADSLLRIVELRIAPTRTVLATGIFSRPSRLRTRIEMLLQRGREFSPVVARIPLAAAALLLTCLATVGSLAPHWIVFAQRLQFAVASVKRNVAPLPNDILPRRSGDLVTMHNAPLAAVVKYAYHITATYQLIGFKPLPEDWFDIDARIGRDAGDDEVRLMFQSLLEDRFKLQAHRETREIPEYELVIGKGKTNLAPSHDGKMTTTIENKTINWPAGKCVASAWSDGMRFICHAATVATIASQISSELRAPVVEHTGLTGLYDVNFRFLNDVQKPDPDREPGPSLEEAIQQELGLKLVKVKGPVEVIVIDHLEKPSENQ